MQISKSVHIFLLSERGYAKLIKIMDTDLAWVIHGRLIDEYFCGCQLNLAEGQTAGTPGVIGLVTPHFRASTILGRRVSAYQGENFSL